MQTYNIWGDSKKKRKVFKVSTKKKEWNKAAGRDEDDFKSISKCRKCKMRLIWGNRGYDFDHKDNNPANSSQRNCYLVCKNCHGKHTVIKKKKKNIFGMTVGYKTIKKKVGYKKTTRKKKPKKKTIKKKENSLFGGLKPPKIKFGL